MTLHTKSIASWFITVTCSSRRNPGKGCGAKCKVTAGDVYWGELDGRAPESAGAYLMQCHECGAWTDLCAFAVPDVIGRLARQRGLPATRQEAFVRPAAFMLPKKAA
jgi:hypothetical protein